jgi:hypothetical protein
MGLKGWLRKFWSERPAPPPSLAPKSLHLMGYRPVALEVKIDYDPLPFCPFCRRAVFHKERQAFRATIKRRPAHPECVAAYRRNIAERALLSDRLQNARTAIAALRTYSAPRDGFDASIFK